MDRRGRRWRRGFFGVWCFGAAILSPHSVLANDANVVLYNQHTAEKGETEIEVFSDFADVGSGEPNYTAQLFELEHGFTDLWTSSLYLEGAKTEGESYDYASFRFENRVRLSKDVTFFNPVLYVEYEQKEQRLRLSQLSLVEPTSQKGRRRLSTNWRRDSFWGTTSPIV